MPPASRSWSGSLVRGRPRAMLIKPSRPSRIGGPADDLAATRTVAIGMPQRPPGHHDEQDRSDIGERADDAGHADPDVVPDRRANPTRTRAHHDRAAEQKQAEAVAAQRRIDIPRTGADPPGGIPAPPCASPTQNAAGSHDRSGRGSTAAACAPAPPARAASADAPCPGGSERRGEDEVLLLPARPRFRARPEGPELLRGRGGEDARVAMGVRLRDQRRRRAGSHTPGAARALSSAGRSDHR